MTDETPSPTTRMPVPEPASDKAFDAPTEGWPGTTVDEDVPASDPALPAGTPSTIDRSDVAPVPPLVVPAPRRERDHGRTASILFGLVILGVGLWFFAEHTLGIELPRIRWSQIWPLFLVIIGVWVVLGSMRRGSR